MKINPYLHFNGHAEEAIAFYTSALGATVNLLMRFKENPDMPEVPAEMAEKVMHADLSIGGNRMMISDGQCSGEWKFEGISLAMEVPTVAEAERIFGALAEGGKVVMPVMKTFYSPGFGMVDDKFGVSWMIMAAA